MQNLKNANVGTFTQPLLWQTPSDVDVCLWAFSQHTIPKLCCSEVDSVHPLVGFFVIVVVDLDTHVRPATALRVALDLLPVYSFR